MNPLRVTTNTIVTTLAAAGTCLALAAPASAGWQGGSLDPAHEASSLGCASYPCTLAQGHFANRGSATFSGRGVVTGWRVKLAPDTTATLKLLRGNDGFRAMDTGPSVDGTGGLVTVNTQIPLEAGAYYAGIELDDGAVLTDHDSDPEGATTLVFKGSLSPFAYSGVDSVVHHELLSQVRVEADVDNDGLGDETQDDCVGDCHAHLPNESAEVGQPDNPGRPQTGIGPGTISAGGTPPPADSNARRPAVNLIIQGRARSRGRAPIRVRYTNRGRYSLAGGVKVLYKGKALARRRRLTLAVDADGGSSFAPSAKLRRAIRRTGKAKVMVVATVTASNGTRATVKRTVVVEPR